MGQAAAPQRKFSENIIELFDVRDVYQDIKNFWQQHRDRLTGNYNPGVASPVPLHRSNIARDRRHEDQGDRAMMDMSAGHGKSLEEIETETLLSHAVGDDQFELVVSSGADGDEAIAIDSVSSDGGLLPLHAERARSHDA